MALPVTLRRVPADRLWPALSVLGLMAVASLTAWLVANRVTRHSRWLPGWGLIALGVVALWVVAYVAVPDRPEHALPFAAGVAVSVAPVRRLALRLPVQLLVVVGSAQQLAAAGRDPRTVVTTVLLLVAVVWVSVVLARSLEEARRSQQRARRAAERRAELLAAVRDLSGRDTREAAATVTRSLRSLGCAAAGVLLDRGGTLEPVAVDGIILRTRLTVAAGVVGTAVVENRRVGSEGDGREPRGLPGGDHLGAVVAVPIRVDGAAVGAVFGGRREAGDFPAASVEVAEVLAAHLGGVIEAEERVARQRELLHRMERLERMRSRLLAEVSEEIRDPLTVVRSIAETLVVHAEGLDAEERTRLLEGFEEQAAALRVTIDTLLDFSRLQMGEPLETLVEVSAGELLAPVLDPELITSGGDERVRTDPSLLRRAVEILAGEDWVAAVRVVAAPEQVRVALDMTVTTQASRSRLLLGLVERLVVAAGGAVRVDDECVELLLEPGRVAAAGTVEEPR